MSGVLEFLSRASFGVPIDGAMGFVLRATFVLGLGGLMLRIARGASAAVRHRIAIATLATSLALPLASWLPAVSLPWLPARWPVAAPAERYLDAVARAVPTTDVRAELAASPTTSAPAKELTPVLAGHEVVARVPTPIDWLGIVTMLGALPSLALLVRIALSFAAARRLARGATPVADGPVRDSFLAACRELQVARPVALLETPRLTIPAVRGIVRPTLLLPRDASAWPAERLRAVMLHELAHVARADGISLLVLRASTAVFWYHPLAWAVADQARLACEQACDDVVLAAGGRASAYAEDLLALAAGAGRRDPLRGAATAFARRSSLEHRLVRILSPDARRGPASRAATAAIATLALVVAVCIGTVRVVAAPADEPKRDDTQVYFADNRGHDSERGEQHFDRARELYQRKRYLEAGREYVQAAELDYDAGTAYYNGACSFALAGQTTPAIDALLKSLDAGFEDLLDYLNDDEDLESIRSDARYRTLVDRVQHSDPAKIRNAAAKRRFDKLTARHSNDESAWAEVGIDLMRTGDPTRAIQAFRNAYAADSSASQIYNEACALSIAGRTQEGLKTLERAILAGSGDPDHMAKDQDIRALRAMPEYRRVAELARELELEPEPWIDRRNAAAWRRTLPRYERVVRDHPQIGRAWANLAYARLFAKDGSGSVEAYQRALSLGYQPRTTMYNLGCAYAQSRNPDEAIRWLERAERAGFEVGNYALHDQDLDPLRSDRRFQAMVGRWHSAQQLEQRTKWKQQHPDDADDDEGQ